MGVGGLHIQAPTHPRTTHETADIDKGKCSEKFLLLQKGSPNEEKVGAKIVPKAGPSASPMATSRRFSELPLLFLHLLFSPLQILKCSEC